MSQLAFLLGKKFKGGPDFRLNSTRKYDLEGIEFELTIPDSNVLFEKPRHVSHFPFREPGWFEQNCQQLWNHFYVSLLAGGMWAYVGPYWKVMREPFGTLGLSIRIKRSLPGYSLVYGDMPALETAIFHDYKDYFEAEPGRYGRGRNTRVLREAEEKYGKPYMLNNPDMQKRKQHYIKKYSRQIPEKFEIREYGTQAWLYYAIEKEPNYPCHHYCQALNERYYLDVRFEYGLDFRNYFHLWKDHAEAAEQRMIETMRLTFPNRVETPNQSKG